MIKECVHMCQMVAQFGTRWTCVFVFLYLYIWICVFVFAFFVLCIVQTSIKFNLWLNFHLRLADGTEQIQFGDLFRLTESLTNKCVGILQRARKHRLPFTLFTFYLEADLWSTTEKNHPFWQRGDLTLTCELCRLIHFAGDTLWQGEDDQKLVTLIRRNREVQVWLFKTIQEFYQEVHVKSSTLRFFSQNHSRMISIQVYFEHTRQLLPNNPGSNTVFGELSYHWSLSLPRFKSIVVLNFCLSKNNKKFVVSYHIAPTLCLQRCYILLISLSSEVEIHRCFELLTFQKTTIILLFRVILSSLFLPLSFSSEVLYHFSLYLQRLKASVELTTLGWTGSLRSTRIQLLITLRSFHHLGVDQ